MQDQYRQCPYKDIHNFNHQPSWLKKSSIKIKICREIIWAANFTEADWNENHTYSPDSFHTV